MFHIISELLLVPVMIFVNMGGSTRLKQRNGELVVGWPRSEKWREACSWNCKASIILYLHIYPSKVKLNHLLWELIKERFNSKYEIEKKKKQKLLDCGAVSSGTSDGDSNGGGGAGAVVVLVAAVRSGERRQMEVEGCGCTLYHQSVTVESHGAWSTFNCRRAF